MIGTQSNVAQMIFLFFPFPNVDISLAVYAKLLIINTGVPNICRPETLLVPYEVGLPRNDR